MRKNSSGNVVIILLITVAFGVGLYIFNSQKNVQVIQKPTMTPSPTLSMTIPPTKDPIFQKVKDLMEKEIRPDRIVQDEENAVLWISMDDYNIVNNNLYGIRSQFSCGGAINSRYQDELEHIASVLPTLMKNEGFTKNMVNSSKSLDDDKFYNYIQAYEKGKLKCTLTARSDCRSDGTENGIHMRQEITFSCTSDFDKNYAQQVPFLKDLNIKGSMVAYLDSATDKFIRLNVGSISGGGGVYIIAMKDNGKWKEIARGQEAIRCSILDTYQIPEEIYKREWCE